MGFLDILPETKPMDDLIYVGNVTDLRMALNEKLLYRYGINWLNDNEFEIYTKPADLGLIPYERIQQALLKRGIGAKLHFVLKEDQYKTHLVLKCKSIIGVNQFLFALSILLAALSISVIPSLLASDVGNLFYLFFFTLLFSSVLGLSLQKGFKAEIAHNHELLINEIKQL